MDMPLTSHEILPSGVICTSQGKTTSNDLPLQPWRTVPAVGTGHLWIHLFLGRDIFFYIHIMREMKKWICVYVYIYIIVMIIVYICVCVYKYIERESLWFCMCMCIYHNVSGDLMFYLFMVTTYTVYNVYIVCVYIYVVSSIYIFLFNLWYNTGRW